MTTITPLFGDVFLKSDFLALLTTAANDGFISIDFALSMTESAAASPSKTRIKLSAGFTSVAALRDSASYLRDLREPASGRTAATDYAIERALEKMENSHEL